MEISKYRLELKKDQRPLMVEEEQFFFPGNECKDVEAVVSLLREYCHLDRMAEEHIFMVAFNVRQQPVGVFELSHGTVDASIITPREIFMRAVMCGAKTMLIGHNHPSGVVDPSKYDDQVCDQIRSLGDMMKIHLIDFLILGSKGTYYSYMEQGRME